MKLWIDAQLPPSLAEWLRDEHGIDATHVQDVDLLTAGDATIFAAAGTAGAIVVTKAPVATPKSPTRGRVKIPHLRVAGTVQGTLLR